MIEQEGKNAAAAVSMVMGFGMASLVGHVSYRLGTTTSEAFFISMVLVFPMALTVWIPLMALAKRGAALDGEE